MASIIDDLNSQQVYNSRKASKYKDLYYGSEISIIVLTITTTVMLTVSDIPPLLPAITSGLAATIKGIAALFSFNKNWINCRTISEALKVEKRKFENGVLEYIGKTEDEKKMELAIRLNSIVAEGNNVWQTLVTNEEKGMR